MDWRGDSEVPKRSRTVLVWSETLARSFEGEKAELRAALDACERLVK